MDHYAEAFQAQPGSCWRFMWDQAGRPTACVEPVAWHGRFRTRKGRWYEVDSCGGHAEGLLGLRRPVPGSTG